MRRVVKMLFAVAAVAVVSMPAPARADGFLTPWAGEIFSSPSSGSGAGKATYGASLGATGSVIGAEFEFGYSPNFFGSSTNTGTNSLIDGMVNAIIEIPFADNLRDHFEPYVIVGTGLIRSQIDGGTLIHVQTSNNQFGINAGGGFMGYFAKHFGVRGDVRYLRTVTGTTTAGIDFGSLHFWRVTGGLIIRLTPANRLSYPQGDAGSTCNARRTPARKARNPDQQQRDQREADRVVRAATRQPAEDVGSASAQDTRLSPSARPSFTRPSMTRMTRVAVARAKSSSCVAMRIVRFRLTSCRMSTVSSARLVGSSDAVGSSINNTVGSTASARAMATRWASPPDSSRGRA